MRLGESATIAETKASSSMQAVSTPVVTFHNRIVFPPLERSRPSGSGQKAAAYPIKCRTSTQRTQAPPRRRQRRSLALDDVDGPA
jgi:hypothetical protein